ncbi:MAG: peptidoglycan-binding domain-containing protein, partial [Anaerolineae bacterium]
GWQEGESMASRRKELQHKHLDPSRARPHPESRAQEQAARVHPSAEAAGIALRAAPETVPPAEISRLEHALGNRNLLRVLSAARSTVRRALTEEERAQNLVNEPYASSTRLQQVYDNNPPMRQGESGSDVALVQQGLIADGILMPISTGTGAPTTDGIFGSETRRAVVEFQQRHGLDVDGVVGRQTMGCMDDLAGAGPSTGSVVTGEVEPAVEIPGLSVPGQSTGGTGLNVPAGASAEITLAALEAADRNTLDALLRNPAFLNGLYQQMTPAQFGRAAACLILRLADGLVYGAEAKAEALRILSVQLGGDKEVARRSIVLNAVQVFPANRLLTDYDPFRPFRNNPSDAQLRIATQVSGRHTAVGEDLLLGRPCTAMYVPTSGPSAGIPQPVASQQMRGLDFYFAHALDVRSLSPEYRAVITAAYNARKPRARADLANRNMWADGREGCAASANSGHYFAALSSAYLGTNTGVDRATHEPRNNGRAWVQVNDPIMFALLERLYAGGQIGGAGASGSTGGAGLRVPSLASVLPGA